MKRIKLFQPYISEFARENVQKVLLGTQIAQGPLVDKFEEQFAKTFGFQPWQCVTVNSGTSALELAYDLCRIEEGDEVITPVLTCTATNIPLVRRKAKIVFADIEGSNNLNIDPGDVRRKITQWTRAVVFVHFGGNSDGLREIEHICDEEEVDLICDAAQALGSKLSSSARFSCISLQAIKSLTAGDGGILICRDQADAIKARKLRWFGYDRALKQKLGDCDLNLAGYKYHMNDVNAAIGLGNLKDWNHIKSHREAINAVYARYGEGQGYIPGIWSPQVVEKKFGPMSVCLDFKSVEIGQHHSRNDKYTIFKNAKSDCPEMDLMEKHWFMLPCHMGMTVEDAEYIAQLIWQS